MEVNSPGLVQWLPIISSVSGSFYLSAPPSFTCDLCSCILPHSHGHRLATTAPDRKKEGNRGGTFSRNPELCATVAN